MMKRIFTALALVSVSACGFQPVYGGSAASLSGRGNVTVDQIDGRTGHELRKALLQELSAGLPGLEGGATLTVAVEDNVRRLAFKPDGAASRSGYVLEGRYVLAFEQDAIAGEVETTVNFNVPEDPYADITAQNDASKRAASDLARQIVDDLRIKLTTGK